MKKVSLSLAHHDYLIRYSNGFKRHVSRAELDLLGVSVRKVSSREYYCTVSIQEEREITSGPNYLGLELIFENPPDREYEREQTPRGMIARLGQMGFVAEQVVT